MKKIALSLSLAILSFSAFSQQQPTEKVFIIKLTESQLNAVLSLINDAPLPGDQRRAFDKIIRDQAIAQIPKDTTAAKPQPQLKDQPKKEEPKKN